MFQSWRIYLRQADAAWRAGQLDAASRLMLEHRLAEFLPGKELANCIAGNLVSRGRQYVDHGDTSAAWRDLDAATRIAGESSESLDLRERLVAAAISEAERYLAAEDCSTALACLNRLRERRCDTPAARLLEQTAKRAQAAARLIRRGDFLAAEAELSAAARLRGDLASLENRLAQCRVQLGAARSWTARLNQAVAGGDWLAAIQACDQLLAIAPDNGAAQQARQHAAGRLAALAAAGVRMAPAPVMAEVVDPPARRAASPAARRVETPRAAANVKQSTRRGRIPPGSPISSVVAAMSAPTSATSDMRLIAWVDAVGGYLICAADQIVLGQAAAGGPADVPFLADLSRRHAVIRRDGESYTIVPLQRTLLDGRELTSPTLLTAGATIELGDGVRLRFRRPHPLSATAVIDFVSQHRTRPKVDGVILMAQTCVMGPKPTSHVVCPDWVGEAIFFREGKNLTCRANGVLEIDGEKCDGRGVVQPGSKIRGQDFAMYMETLEKA